MALRRTGKPDGPASPFPGVRHRGPRFLGRLRLALLQQLDRMLVGRAHERHVAVAWRPVDGDPAPLQLLTGRPDGVDLLAHAPQTPPPPLTPPSPTTTQPP